MVALDLGCSLPFVNASLETVAAYFPAWVEHPSLCSVVVLHLPGLPWVVLVAQVGIYVDVDLVMLPEEAEYHQIEQSTKCI